MARASERAERMKMVRCAIYTRKSTEEGLDQSFNSLDAQREACEAYVRSQRHEGWTLTPDSYDDGGHSGGNMERPALKRLLADVEAGRVDVIVVYKVDRLTRALSDFAKIVEVLDKREASFVSVTQSFNTTTSMGRLTLNVLLSFAQFEREVTGERIRDKFAASKAKGMWMGGTIPLGYDIKDRKLIVNEVEAEQVRHVFRRYAALGSGRLLIEELRATGYRTKRAGSRGGNIFARGSLFHLLNNRLYLGEITHRGTAYPGQHDAIVAQELWDAVQETMSRQRVERQRGSNSVHPSLLAGRIHDGEGRRMSPSHAVKSGKRYRYYVTPADDCTTGDPTPWRIPAIEVETAVVSLLKTMLGDRRQIVSIVGSSDSAILNAALIQSRLLLRRLEDSAEKRAIMNELDVSVRLGADHVEVVVAGSSVAASLGTKIEADEGAYPPITLRASAIKARRGNDIKLIIADHHGRADAFRDPALINLLVEARATYQLMLDSPDISIRALVKQHSRCRNRFYKLLRVAMLAPDIVMACVEGTQPVHLTAARLLEAQLPMRWQDQRKLLGFA